MKSYEVTPYKATFFTAREIWERHIPIFKEHHAFSRRLASDCRMRFKIGFI